MIRSLRTGGPALAIALILAVLGTACVSSRRAKKGPRGFEQSGIAS